MKVNCPRQGFGRQFIQTDAPYELSQVFRPHVGVLLLLGSVLEQCFSAFSIAQTEGGPRVHFFLNKKQFL